MVAVAAYVGLVAGRPEAFGRRMTDYLLIFQAAYVKRIPITDENLGEPGYVWRYVPLDAAPGDGRGCRSAVRRRGRPAGVAGGRPPTEDPDQTGRAIRGDSRGPTR